MSNQPLQPPSLTELLTGYLQGQKDAQAAGLGFVETTGDVLPYEAVPLQPIDPKQAWEDALAVLAHFASLPKTMFQVPPDWPAVVSNQEPAVALAFCLGNTPQFVRDLQPFLTSKELSEILAPSSHSAAVPALDGWASGQKETPAKLVAAGVLRLTGQFENARTLLSDVTGPWQIVAANEIAAITWHEGQKEQAAALWNKQQPSTPVLFNRGMAALFLGDTGGAKTALGPAVEAIPDTSPWHHLGRLYLALADARK